MRPVDLNALEPEICKACAKTFCEFPCEPADCEILRVLRNAPTIEQPAWIDCKDRLPQEGEPLGSICEIVQVLLKDGTVTAGFCNRSLQAWVYLPANDVCFVGHGYAETPVVAWKPLSEPPKGDE